MSEQIQAKLTSRSGVAMMLQEVKASGAVKGRLLVMSLEQSYRNPSNTNTEITYTFPLPFGAVLLESKLSSTASSSKGRSPPKALPEPAMRLPSLPATPASCSSATTTAALPWSWAT